jgi:hypothetical protein
VYVTGRRVVIPETELVRDSKPTSGRAV